MAESLMTDTCTIERAGADSFNATTLERTNNAANIYTGVCRVTMPTSLSVRDAESVGRVMLEQQLSLSLPVETSVAVRANDIVTITASSADAGLVGRKFRISGTHHSSSATARRLPLVEVSQ